MSQCGWCAKGDKPGMRRYKSGRGYRNDMVHVLLNGLIQPCAAQSFPEPEPPKAPEESEATYRAKAIIARRSA